MDYHYVSAIALDCWGSNNMDHVISEKSEEIEKKKCSKSYKEKNYTYDFLILIDFSSIPANLIVNIYVR